MKILVSACLLGLFFPYKAVKGVQRVEKEVRIHLSLQLLVTELGYVLHFLFLAHLVSGRDGVIDHIDYAVYGHLSYQ